MITALTLADLMPAQMAFTPEQMRVVVENVMAGARNEWVKLARARFHRTLQDYLDGLQPVELGDGYAAVALVGDLALMLENGAPRIDMRDTLLGPNVPVAGPGQRGKHRNKEGGFYRAIPFRHQVPGTQGVGGGAVMGSQYFKSVPDMAGQLQKQLGRAVHAAAKQLTASKGMPGGGTRWGGRLPAGTGGAGLLRPHHTTDIYAGMVRQSKTYGKATQNTYTTFRTISTNSAPETWIRPPTEGAHLVNDVVAYVEENASKAFLAVLGGPP